MLDALALRKAILESAHVAIIATDAQGIVRLFNAGAEAMLGYAAMDVVGRISPGDIHDPGEVAARTESLSLEFGTSIRPGFEAMAFKASRGIEDSYELTYIRKDGTRFPAVVSISALRNEADAIIGYLLIGRDNTARKRFEAELGAALALADRASRAKTDFIAGMSHELRTPLNAILGFAQLLDTGVPAPTLTQKRDLGQILKAGWYLLELINEILDLALIESGKLSLSQEPVALADLLPECLAMVESQAVERGIAIGLPRFDAPVYVQADRTRFKQVLINLLSNAIKYNRDNGRVDLTCEARPEGRLRIGVRDTGSGLTPEQLGQLFQPFNRLGRESGAQEGAGIGLVVTKRLVGLMGGSIGAASEPGVGSEFWIDMKAAAAPRHAVPEPRPASPSTAAVAGATRQTLLYVEDNPANLTLVEQLVARRADLALISAIDGEGGVALARAVRPAVILMDINLPGINGITALRILRADSRTSHIPVIALSANAAPRAIAQAIEQGFFDYLTKPIRVDLFMQCLDAALAFARSPACRPSTGAAV
ncbi:MAG: ATP-binding protein [Burkholderiales bacterium]